MMRRIKLAILVLMLAAPALAQTSTPTPTWTPLPTWTITPTPMPGQIAPGPRTWCGAGLPCGQIPWPIIRPPALASPTPIPTIVITATPTPTETPATPSPTWTPGGPTATPQPTATMTDTPQPDLSALDTGPIMDTVATWQAVISATQPPILVNGTPMDGVVIDGLEDGARDFFGRVQGLTSVSLGKISPLISWLLFAVGVLLFVTVTTFLLPVIMAVFGVIRKLIQLVLDFLPL